jgi:DNA polymerase (family X)
MEKNSPIIPGGSAMDNRIIAECLRCHAQELDAEGGNLYRVRAYRHAAEIVVELAEPVSRIFERGGRRGLQALPGVGSHIARTIESLLLTGETPPRVEMPVAC